jgi:sporulation protein YlmC with PRC-barrel domain
MKLRNSLLAAACLALAAAPVTAQNDPKNDPAKAPAVIAPRSDATQGRVWRASELLDADVKSPSRDKLGDMKDLVIDEQCVCVAYAIVKFDKFLKANDRLYAIPFNALQRTGDKDTIVLNQTKEQMELAPAFEEKVWPKFDRKYGESVFRYYKTTPYWEDRSLARHTATNPRVGPTDPTDPSKQADPTKREPEEKVAHAKEHSMRETCLASEAIGTDVVDPAGKGLGDVEDIVIDDANGRVVYAVPSFGGFLGMGDKLFAIPFGALHRSPTDKDKLVLDIPKDKLEKAPGFDKKNWPDMADQRWGLEIHRYYGQDAYWEHPAEKSDK